MCITSFSSTPKWKSVIFIAGELFIFLPFKKIKTPWRNFTLVQWDIVCNLIIRKAPTTKLESKASPITPQSSKTETFPASPYPLVILNATHSWALPICCSSSSPVTVLTMELRWPVKQRLCQPGLKCTNCFSCFLPALGKNAFQLLLEFIIGRAHRQVWECFYMVDYCLWPEMAGGKGLGISPADGWQKTRGPSAKSKTGLILSWNTK